MTQKLRKWRLVLLILPNRGFSLLQPRLIVALGRHAAHYLLNSEESLMKLRGKLHQFDTLKIPLLVTYHPAYLLRNPADKAKAYQDWVKVRQFL